MSQLRKRIPLALQSESTLGLGNVHPVPMPDRFATNWSTFCVISLRLILSMMVSLLGTLFGNLLTVIPRKGRNAARGFVKPAQGV